MARVNMRGEKKREEGGKGKREKGRNPQYHRRDVMIITESVHGQ